MSNTPYETVHTPAALFPREQAQLSGNVTRALRKGFDLLYTWQGRVQERAHLASIEDYLLSDMGISRAQADNEAAKPFWRP